MCEEETVFFADGICMPQCLRIGDWTNFCFTVMYLLEWKVLVSIFDISMEMECREGNHLMEGSVCMGSNPVLIVVIFFVLLA